MGDFMDREANQSESHAGDLALGATGDSGSLFEIDRLPFGSFPLASQTESNQTRARELMGEFELMRATLDDAIHTYRKYAHVKGRRAQRLFREVDEWVSAEDYSWPFSFVNICEVLDLDPDYIRTGLRLWRERAQSDPRTVKRSAA
jgi:hypothetical protein